MKVVKLICQHCHKEFEEIPSKKDRKYCTFRCYQASRTKKINIICKTCHKQFKAYPTQHRQFCCDRCMYINDEWREKQRRQTHTLETKIKLGKQSHLRNVGKLNPNYKHGLYALFGLLRRQANGICTECRQGIIGQLDFLDMHHIDQNRENNVIDNLIMICPNCHRKKHLKRKNQTASEYKKYDYE